MKVDDFVVKSESRIKYNLINPVNLVSKVYVFYLVSISGKSSIILLPLVCVTDCSSRTKYFFCRRGWGDKIMNFCVLMSVGVKNRWINKSIIVL